MHAKTSERGTSSVDVFVLTLRVKVAAWCSLRRLGRQVGTFGFRADATMVVRMGVRAQHGISFPQELAGLSHTGSERLSETNAIVAHPHTDLPPFLKGASSDKIVAKMIGHKVGDLRPNSGGGGQDVLLVLVGSVDPCGSDVAEF